MQQPSPIVESFLEHAVESSLIDLLDKKLLLCLRDGRTFMGIFRTFDQFSNVLLEKTIERKIFKTEMYADCPVGVFMVRGENIVLIGEVDEKKDAESIKSMKKVSEETIKKAIAEDALSLVQQNKIQKLESEFDSST
eukprot:TRINITY_DN560_c0_g1_i1.p1 TRINITY_DN560_c0_g1~~TRINITY_DN560_c0_g1_i1.p1  ORF type:complete len:137 (-),score=27.09 TRINITY_DN560_c0_g1_i1:392-802(-)